MLAGKQGLVAAGSQQGIGSCWFAASDWWLLAGEQ
jgi:hypothetical protein